MSYYRSRYGDSGLSYWSGYGNNRWTSYKPKYQTGKTKPSYDNFWWKNRKYIEDNEDTAKKEGKDVLSVDFLKDENRSKHHTADYEVTDLIVRRGQDFNIIVKSEVSFDKVNDRLQIFLSTGEKPQENKGTLINLNIYKDKQSADREARPGWVGYVTSVNGQASGSSISLAIRPSADALVGKYTVRIKMYGADLNEQKKRYIKDLDDPVYVLFNVWCKEDRVYMDKEPDREEYVLNENGRIWVGRASNPGSRPWNFGQFSEHSFLGALYLLEKCNTLNTPGYGNVTLVARALSSMANSCDGKYGVLTGNWSGSYSGGKSPLSWNGSEAIMDEYMLTKTEVKYGQCWVFSGLLTTLCRTLGIPARPVTNFQSAHDCDNSMTIDKHFSVSGKPLSDMDDSIWNFHVWNECHFTRPDLPDGNDGWQAIDATPQELSESLYRCGPAPVNAIKQGNVYLSYDTKFIFAEVNADVVEWYVFGSGNMYAKEEETKSVGQKISTKQVGSDERKDITINYKYPEDSPKEREAVERASSYSSRVKDLWNVYEGPEKDVIFEYNGKMKENGDVDVSLIMDNVSKEVRNVTVTITATAAYYTGISGEQLSDKQVKVELQPGKSKTEDWSIKAEDYFNIIDEDATLKLYIIGVTNTDQIYTKTETFTLDKPDLVLELSTKTPRVGESFNVSIAMVNPLNMKLTEGVIRLEGPGIQKDKKIPLHRSIPPNGELLESVTLTAKYSGKRTIMACFNCRQLTGITGSVPVEVKK